MSNNHAREALITNTIIKKYDAVHKGDHKKT